MLSSTKTLPPAITEDSAQATPTSKAAFLFLCAVPFLDMILFGVRALRIPGIHQIAGLLYFSLVTAAAWSLGCRALKTGSDQAQRLALAGALLLAPFATMGLLWIGIGAPWQATLQENNMRFIVLVSSAAAITAGFVVLQQALREDGEDVYSPLALAVGGLASAAFFVWLALPSGIVLLKMNTGQISDSARTTIDLFDTLQFFACTLMYLGALLFAVCMRRTGWIGRGATIGFAVASAVCIAALCFRGINYPDLNANTTPWYVRPGFFVGIPAVPWIMPCLLGVIALQRAGRQISSSARS